MSASGDDPSTRKRRRLVPALVDTGVLAVIGGVMLAVVLSGCRGPSGGPGPTAGSRSAAPTYGVTATMLAKHPEGVAVDPGTHTVYVTNRGDNTVSVIDAATRTVTATVPTVPLNDPWGVAVDPGTRTVYVINDGAADPRSIEHGTVSVIDASTRTVTATVPAVRGAVGVAVDPGTHTVYVTGGNTVWVIESR